VNLVPAQYREVSVTEVPVPLEEDALRGYLVGRDVYRRTRYVIARHGAAVAERHADDLIAGERGAVPRSVQGDEGVAAALRREHRAAVEQHAEGRGVRFDEQGRVDALRHEVAPFAGVPRIFVRADVRIRPAVERAVADVGDVVGNEIVAETVAFIDRGPERAALRLECQADGIAKSAREDA